MATDCCTLMLEMQKHCKEGEHVAQYIVRDITKAVATGLATRAALG